METTDFAESELWLRYRCEADDAARDRLFMHHAPWATAIARHVHGRVRAYQVDREDFIQNATIGLLEAMSRFDPHRGVAFRAYAKPRVRGAVFNGLRSILGERPSPRDESYLAARLDSLQEAAEGEVFERMIGSIVELGVGYLLDEAHRSQDVESVRDGLAYAQASETESRLLAAVGQLPERMKLIIQAHYFQYVPFQDLAAQAGITKGRISQLHRAALLKLRDALR